jgi:predicted house-cleaning noncanonical NTP pyrophosphatase (MazG superfamily)
MKSKLVRDNIPAIIRSAGKSAITHIAAGDEAKQFTIAKVKEELEEFMEDSCLEEAADIYHAFEAMIITHGMSWDEVINAAVKKASVAGRFTQLIILDRILDTPTENP